eukprot:TRINITY_DN14981_c0_g1_i1.p1 TRINITY_DN14981_c0_g1~~TRINITY_DN14981_c0_g1_i1.p1  ORF type:complete len:466 (-),score=91.81 TRINITY_DN14981_c0_g1_i1:66-1463(-)
MAKLGRRRKQRENTVHGVAHENVQTCNGKLPILLTVLGTGAMVCFFGVFNTSAPMLAQPRPAESLVPAQAQLQSSPAQQAPSQSVAAQVTSSSLQPTFLQQDPAPKLITVSEMPSSVTQAAASPALGGQVAGEQLPAAAVQEKATPEVQVSLRPRSTDFDIDLVVAAFAEDVSWVEPMLQRVKPGAELRLYCKGPRIKDERCLRIENYGGEEYAYLTHIIHFYDTLAPITVFTLGSIYNRDWDFLKCRKLNFVLSQVDTPEKRANFSGFVTMAHQAPDSFMEFEGYFKLEQYRNHAGGKPTPACRASIKPLDKWFKEFIVDVPLEHARHTGVLYNPIFAVSKERIHRFPKSMYEKLHLEILRCTEKQYEGVAEAGHFLERAWKPMFETYRPAAFKCAGHFGQKKGDPMCCNQKGTIGLPWTICKEERPTCSGLIDGSGWGTCMPADLGTREDVCPDVVVKRAPAK